MKRTIRICAAAAMLSANGWAADGVAPAIPPHGVDIGVCAVVKAFMDEAEMANGPG